MSPALEIETGPWAAGIPHLVSRVLVTAALGDHTWAEWRHWVGQAVAEIGRSEVQVPTWLREKQDRALAEVARRVDEAGFLIREGILTHDTGVLAPSGCERRPGQCTADGTRRCARRVPARSR